MARAIFNGVVIAESDQTEMVEGNHYFPSESINNSYFQESSKTTVCGWKGLANYYDVVVNGEVGQNAAWYYTDPKPAAANIKDYVAFWGAVQVEDQLLNTCQSGLSKADNFLETKLCSQGTIEISRRWHPLK